MNCKFNPLLERLERSMKISTSNQLELACCNCKLNSPGKLLKKVRYTLIEIHLNKLTYRKSNPLVKFLKQSLKKYSTWMAIRESLELCGDLYIPSWVISYFSHHLRKASLCVIRERWPSIQKENRGSSVYTTIKKYQKLPWTDHHRESSMENPL